MDQKTQLPRPAQPTMRPSAAADLAKPIAPAVEDAWRKIDPKAPKEPK